jgi:3-dehydroquinate dehydratase-2
MKKILILNGPNLNLLHLRDKEIYGDLSLSRISSECEKIAKECGIEVDFQQSNSEGELVDMIQSAIDGFDGIIINAAAYTHTSVAIRDALEIFKKPKIELHISNIFRREEFRHHSFLSDVVDGVICGLGCQGYGLAVHAISQMIK